MVVAAIIYYHKVFIGLAKWVKLLLDLPDLSSVGSSSSSSSLAWLCVSNSLIVSANLWMASSRDGDS